MITHTHTTDVHLEDHAVKIDGLRVFYRTGGDPARQPLLFLHGWGLRWDRFGPYVGNKVIVQELAKHYYVVAPELPGLMRSETPETFLGYEKYSKIIHSLLEHLHIEKPIIMGQSFGGTIASIYTKLYPANVSHLVLVNSILNYEASRAHPKLLQLWGKLFPKILSSAFVPKFMKKLVIYGFFGTPFSYITNEEIRRKAHMEDPLLYVYDLDFNYLQVPLLMVWGQDDSKVPLRKAEEILKQVPNSKLITIPGGHSVLSFHPHRVIEIIFEQLLPNLPKT